MDVARSDAKKAIHSGMYQTITQSEPPNNLRIGSAMENSTPFLFRSLGYVIVIRDRRGMTRH
jgi:hypothetical protein